MITSDQAAQYKDEAEAAFDQGDVEAAISFYRQAQSLNPGDFKYVSRLGALIYGQFEFQTARVLYEEAIHGMNARNEAGVTLGNLHLALLHKYSTHSKAQAETWRAKLGGRSKQRPYSALFMQQSRVELKFTAVGRRRPVSTFVEKD